MSHPRACYGVLRFIMESGAKGCEVVVSGKLRGQRAKSMKFIDGLMIHSGEPTNVYVDAAVRHVLLRQGKESIPFYVKQWPTVLLCRCTWYQGKDYVAVGPQQQERTQAPAARQRLHLGAQG